MVSSIQKQVAGGGRSLWKLTGIGRRIKSADKEVSDHLAVWLQTGTITMALLQSNLGQLTDPGSFLWSVGLEDTFITAPWPQTGRILDEYELTGHYQHWREDIKLMAELG